MNKDQVNEILAALGKHIKPHPWHGIALRDKKAASDEVNAFIEIVPTDTIKYELDKDSGYLKIDRPQKFSNIVPALYGFVPQTFCAEKVAEFTKKETGIELDGDMDPLDICVLTESHIPRGDLLVEAKIIGGYRMIDGGEADDKILAVLKDDAVYGHINDVSELPERIVNRLKHYFLTYKEIPVAGQKSKVEIQEVYGKEVALKVLELSSLDYINHYSK